MSYAFTPRKVGRYEPRIRVIATELAAQLLANQAAKVDIVSAFAARLPARVIAEIQQALVEPPPTPSVPRPPPQPPPPPTMSLS